MRTTAHREPTTTAISGQLAQDDRLSFKARGIALYLLSFDEHVLAGVATAEAIAQANHCGRDQVTSGLRELERFGYLTRTAIRDTRGRIGQIAYTVTDKPGENDA